MKHHTSFESNNAAHAASLEADKIAREFAAISHRTLTKVEHPDIDSLLFGWSHHSEMNCNDDPDAKYVFVYETQNDFESVYIYPSSKKIVVWHSLTDNNMDNEGALIPRTGKVEYPDDLFDTAFTMRSWKKFFSKNNG